MPALVLLPPSKTMRTDGSCPAWEPAGPLAQQREEVAAAYERTARSSRSRFATAVDASGDLLEDTRDLAAALRSMPTMPAGCRYTGQVHAFGGYADADVEERDRYARHVRVVSGLLGAVRPDEHIPIYRLPMGGTLPRVGPLWTYWTAPLTAELVSQADGAPIWDLLSAEYQRALDLPPAQRVVVRFERPDGRAVHAVQGKQLKGALARYLSSTGGDPSTVGEFRAQDVELTEVRRDGHTTVVFRSPG